MSSDWSTVPEHEQQCKKECGTLAEGHRGGAGAAVPPPQMAPRPLGKPPAAPVNWRHSLPSAAPEPAAVPMELTVSETKHDAFPSFHDAPRSTRSTAPLNPNPSYRLTSQLCAVVNTLDHMQQPFEDVVLGPTAHASMFDGDWDVTFADQVNVGGTKCSDGWFIAANNVSVELCNLLKAHDLFRAFMHERFTSKLCMKLAVRPEKGVFVVFGVDDQYDNKHVPTDCWAVCALKLEKLGAGRVKVHRFEQVGDWLLGASKRGLADNHQYRKEDAQGYRAWRRDAAAKRATQSANTRFAPY